MNIKELIKEDTTHVDIDKLELPDSMQQNTTNGEPRSSNADEPSRDSSPDSSSSDATTTLSLEQLAGMCVIGYNAISCAIYRRIEPTFDASLTSDEMQAIQQPLEEVLRQYDVQVTPVTALAIAVVGVNVAKIMQLQAYRKQLAEKNYTSYEDTKDELQQ